MTVVIDTNVLVSGLINPFSPPGQIVRLISAGKLQLAIDGRLLAEYAHVLHRPKFDFDPELVIELLDQIKHEGTLVAGEPLRRSLPDPDDHAFLEVALAATASCLVTGNIKDFPASSRQGMRVLSPREFLAQLGTMQSE